MSGIKTSKDKQDEEIEKVALPNLDNEKRADTSKKGVRAFDTIAGVTGAFIVALIILAFEPRFSEDIGKTANELLQSNFTLAIMAAIVAPWFARTMKQRLGVQIDENEIMQLFNTTRQSVKITRDRFAKLRENNPDGSLSPEDAEKARLFAVKTTRELLGHEKFKKFYLKVGNAYLGKLIDEYSKSEWAERFPIEKQQVQELVTVAVKTYPKINELIQNWNKTPPERRAELIKEVRADLTRLLHSVGINGWGSDILDKFIHYQIVETTANTAS